VDGTFSEVVVRDSIGTKVLNFFEGSPVLDVFRDSGITAEAGDCSFTTDQEVFGQYLEFTLCPMEDGLAFFGTIILGIAGLYSILIMMGRA